MIRLIEFATERVVSVHYSGIFLTRSTNQEEPTEEQFGNALFPHLRFYALRILRDVTLCHGMGGICMTTGKPRPRLSLPFRFYALVAINWGLLRNIFKTPPGN